MEVSMTALTNRVSGKSVLFITTKNLDYIRNSQEITLLQKHAASVHIIGSSSPSYPKRLLSVWSRLLFTSIKPYTVVFAGFSPQLIVPLFAFKFRHTFLIEDFFLSLYDTLVCDRQKVAPRSIPGRFLHMLDRITIHKADLIISDTKAHGRYFAAEFGADPARIEPLYLEADPSLYYPRKTQHCGPFRVLYFGSILPLQGLPVILDAVRMLKDRADITFVIVGPIPDTQKKPHSRQIRYIRWLPQEELADEIARADLCLAGHFHPTIQKAQRTIPGKAYIYEAMGKPMILGDNEATRELQHAWKVPVSYVPMGDARALADCILRCKDTALQCPASTTDGKEE